MMSLLPRLSANRVIVFDPHGEYDDPSLVRCDSIGDFKQFILEHVNDKRYSVVWTPQQSEEIPYFLEICYNCHNTWIVIEECNMAGIGNVRQSDPVFINLVNFGRNRMISLICVSKRPNQVNRDLTSQADIIISFRQDEPNDIKYLQEFCGQGVADQVKHLPEHEWRVVYPNIEAELNLDGGGEYM